jgi:predicted SprT family Zn-dependent metalloprotease
MIPKGFELYGQKITVRIDNERCRKEKAVGLSFLNENIILLANKADGRKIPASKVQQTLLHEVGHFIFYYMNERKLCYNEKFIDVFAGLLHQYLKTKK